MNVCKTPYFLLLFLIMVLTGTQKTAFANQERQNPDTIQAEIIDSLIIRSRKMWAVSLDSAYLAARKAVDLAEQYKDARRKAAALNQLGASYQMASNYYRTTESYLEALEIGQNLRDPSLIAGAYNNLGLVHYRMKEFREALDYMWKAHNTFLQTGDSLQLAHIHLNIGALHYEQAHYDSAKFHFNISLQLASIINSETLELWAMNHIADVHGREGNLEKANQLQTIQLQRQQTVRNFLIIIIITIVVLGITIIYSIARRQKIKRQSFGIIEKKNKELEETNEKLRASEQRLRELNLTKDKFFSIIGHDLKSPMNALMGFSELLAGDVRNYSEEEISKYAAVIHKSAENINQLVDNLLEWSRTQTGNIEFNPDHFNLALVVNHIIETNKLQAESKDLNLMNKVPPEAEIFADKNLISTVVRNLLSNAIKFTPPNGTIEIGHSATEKSSKLWVMDNGTGIPEDLHEDIFKLSTARTRQGTRGERGSGLGLLLCKEFVEMHNGTIRVESKVNEGSTFIIEIPNAD